MLKIRELLLILFLLFTITISVMALTYTSQYPTQDADHVKATSTYDVHYPYNATDPENSLTGTYSGNSWLAYATSEQRFHIDLGSAKIIRRIYYENFHSDGNLADWGTKNFTFWGSNTEASFLELTYGTDTGWTQITTSQATFDIHVGSDEADPKYITVTNTTAYRYYAFKFADNQGSANWLGVRRIELQTEDGYPPEEGKTSIMFTFSAF